MIREPFAQPAWAAAHLMLHIPNGLIIETVRG